MNQNRTQVMWLCGWRRALAWELGNRDSVPSLSPDSWARYSVRQKLQHWPPKKTLKSTGGGGGGKAKNPSQGLLLKIK